MHIAELTLGNLGPLIEKLERLKAKADQPQIRCLEQAITALGAMPLSMLATGGQSLRKHPAADFGRRTDKGGGSR